MEDGFMKTWEQCCDYFGVNVDRGLSPSQVKSNLDKYGPNGKHFYNIANFDYIFPYSFWEKIQNQPQKRLTQY